MTSSSTAASSTTSRPRAVEPSCGTRPRHPPTPGQPDGRSIPPFPHHQDIRLDVGGDGLPPGKPGKKGLRALLPDRPGNRSASAFDVPDAPLYLAASDGRAATMTAAATASTTAMQLDMDGTARKMQIASHDGWSHTRFPVKDEKSRALLSCHAHGARKEHAPLLYPCCLLPMQEWSFGRG
ncbi:hypothetical protein PVAP13_4KG104800 [Panicum virgatum]|uniref:Uncharacterized protein n=1 Tax=Panicum virgatum TaxID=38727 RepID=A0A8T0TPB1_PANVG|nr:hypothetical protein PVAP13_4KG104800 [Panicum virgatum]